MDITEFNEYWFGEINKLSPPEMCIAYLKERNGVSLLSNYLPQFFLEQYAPELIEKNPIQQVWELCARYYEKTQRYHEAIFLMRSLYETMCEFQVTNNVRIHKGSPLCWLSDFFYESNLPVFGKAFLMLTLIEDAITIDGPIDQNKTGSYFRLILRGMTHEQFASYNEKALDVVSKYPEERIFPEWVLQEIDNNWITDVGLPQEYNQYIANKIYLKYLFQRLGDSQGKNLERFGEYLMSCLPGVRTKKRGRTYSTDHDIICIVDRIFNDFLNLNGKYVLCECKDLKSTINFTHVAKFSRVLTSTKCKLGIFFTRKGVSGETEFKNGAREILKVFQDSGIAILVFTDDDYHRLIAGENLYFMLREKLEKLSLDLL